MSWLPEMQWLAKIAPQRFLRFSSIAMLARACERGLGIALLPCVVGRRLGLTRLQDGIESKRELWLLSHKDAAQVARFRAVADWVKAATDQDAELLAGR